MKTVTKSRKVTCSNCDGTGKCKDNVYNLEGYCIGTETITCYVCQGSKTYIEEYDEITLSDEEYQIEYDDYDKQVDSINNDIKYKQGKLDNCNNDSWKLSLSSSYDKLLSIPIPKQTYSSNRRIKK